MNVGFMLLVASFMTLLTCSKEVPIEGSTLPPEPDMVVEHHHGPHIITTNAKSKNEEDDEASNEKEVDWDYTVDRTNRSRMLQLSSTLGYDEWWFLTTRRPRLSPKDFPGRPGVATWKEISPSSVENRKSRKENGPRAAGVSSGSCSSTLNYHYTHIISRVVWITFLLFCFCWT